MRALPIALSLGLVFGGLAERGPIAHAQSADVTTIKDELSPGEFRAYGESSPKKLRSRIGELTFTKGGFAGGYPSLETIDTLKNELDFQKATQAYIWAVPIVSYARWLESHEELFGAKDGQIVRLTSPKAKQGILTANATTPYAVAFADLSRTGPLVFDIPLGCQQGLSMTSGSVAFMISGCLVRIRAMAQTCSSLRLRWPFRMVWIPMSTPSFAMARTLRFLGSGL